MSDSAPRTSLVDSAVETNPAASAGRHMKQPLRSTISASWKTARAPASSLIAKWEAESKPNQMTAASNESVSHTIPTILAESSPAEISVVAQKMKLLDERERQHRRKRRIARLVIASVLISIPSLLIVLLFFV